MVPAAAETAAAARNGLCKPAERAEPGRLAGLGNMPAGVIPGPPGLNMAAAAAAAAAGWAKPRRAGSVGVTGTPAELDWLVRPELVVVVVDDVGVVVVTADGGGKEGISHELEDVSASLPAEAERSCTAGVESKEFSEPDKMPAELGLFWLAAAAAAADPILPKRVDIKALLCSVPTDVGVVGLADSEGTLPEAVVPLPLAFTTHFLMCFSRVEATLKGMAQNRHL